MNYTYKQMIVMLFSTLFLAVVAIAVLSSSASASSVPIDTDMYDYESPPYNPDRGLINGIVIFGFIVIVILVFTYNPTTAASDPNEYVGIDWRQIPDDTVIPETVVDGVIVDDYDYDTFMRKWQ